VTHEPKKWKLILSKNQKIIAVCSSIVVTLVAIITLICHFVGLF
jgi:hypothetical protein